MFSNAIFFLFFLLITTSTCTFNRFNYLDQNIPELATQWTDGGPCYSIRNSRLKSSPFFSFQLSEFEPYFLKNEPSIPFRYDHQQHISTQTIENLVNETIVEIKNNKKKLSHAIILQEKNFNWHQSCGLIVLKLKHFPFVVKLFMETPETFTNPYCKGIEPICLFYMGSGASRHLTGWLRVKNLIHINHQLSSMDRWKNYVETPRKWLLIPESTRWLRVTGKNIDNIKHQEINLPATYAIIADYIKFPEVRLSSNQKKNIIMQLCNDLDLAIDPHRSNFIFYINKKEKKLRMFIIDTEHFPTMVGFEGKKQFHSYSEWYLHLAWKCFQDTYLFPKEKRIRKLEPAILTV